MSDLILEVVMGHLDSSALRAVGRHVDVDHRQAEGSMRVAILLLLAAMARNAANTSGAAALNRALARDHCGTIFDRLGSYLGNPDQANGAAILKHVFENSYEELTASLARQLDIEQTAMVSILELAAPLVMGELGLRRRVAKLDDAQLARFLSRQHQQTLLSTSWLKSADEPADNGGPNCQRNTLLVLAGTCRAVS